MRKTGFAICEQRRCRSACAFAQSDRHFVVRCLDSTIPLLFKFKISRIYLASVAAQTGLCLTWSQTPKTCFLVTWLIDISIEITWLQCHRQYHKSIGREIKENGLYIRTCTLS